MVRTINSNMTGDIYIYLRGGTYNITSTIAFGPQDSGTNGCRIYYQAYSDETPVLNGATQVTGWTPESIGAISRAVYESLALEYRSVAEKLAGLTGQPLEVLHIVGGGSQDSFLSQLTANALQLPVTAGPVEATALGNLLVQAISLGAVKDVSESRNMVKRTFAVREFKPEPAAGWDGAYRRYQQLTVG